MEYNYSDGDIFYGYKTIENNSGIILGYDVTGQEYFVFDAREHRWSWFKDLSRAKTYFKNYVKQMK